MKYVSREGATPTPDLHSGFWFQPPEMVYDVTHSSHVMFLFEHPDLFGLTLDEIKRVYAEFGETLGTDGGQARERLVRLVIRSNWIRVRKYQKPSYWSIQCNSTADQGSDIVAFIMWAIESGIMKADDAAAILGFADEEDRHSFSWKEGGIITFLGLNNP